MKLEELKQGDEFYTTTNGMNIIKWEYHSVYPITPSSKGLLYDYHIVINKITERPERVFGRHLQQNLNENLKTYQNAKAKVKEYLEEVLKRFEENY